MRRFLTVFQITLLSLILAGCAGAAAAVTTPPSPDQSQPTLTSVFEPMLTPTPTPWIDTPKVQTPPADAFPGLDIPALESGQVITPTLVNFIDPLIGWGIVESSVSPVSGYVLRTGDGGATWQNVNPLSGYPQSSRFFALDATHAWAAPADIRYGEPVPSGTVYRTSDGGATWQASQPIDLEVEDEPVVEYNSPAALFFLDAQYGWLVTSVGHYMNQDVLEIFKTVDGGLTWQRTTDKYSMGRGETPPAVLAPMPCHVSGIAFVDPQHGFLAGDCLAVGVNDAWSILETKDGGVTWQRTLIPDPSGAVEGVSSGMNNGSTTCAASEVSLTPAGILFGITCQVMDGSGMFKDYPFQFLSPDGGLTWRGWPGQSASFANGDTGFRLGMLNQAGAREFSATTDGGKTWTVETVVSWPQARLDFVTESIGYVLAAGWNLQHDAYDYALVRTRDAGQTWEIVTGSVK